MEVVLPVAPPTPPVDFNFDSNCSSPYITAPSSPQRFANNFFFSAPTSPSRVSPLFSESSLPFHQETKPNNHNNNYSFGNDDDFEFDFSGNLQRESLSAADELFDGGKIRPMKPPPRFHSGDIPNSPRTRKKKTVHNPERDSNPFEAAIEETLRKEEEKRGRERVTSSGRKGSRSLSPLKVSDIIENLEDKDVSVSSSTSNNVKSFLSFTKGYRKWKIRDLFLFRSASEGRANEKDPLRKYTALSKKSVAEDDVRNSSFRSTESSGSFSKGRGPVSAHEIHYTINRAATEEMKKRTFLPYKRGLLGCLGSSHRMDQISRGIGSFSRS